MLEKNIPIGISDFEEIRGNHFYYVDKSGLIAEILRSESVKVSLITRPRRFGKTLGMSMLESFLIFAGRVGIYLRDWKLLGIRNSVIGG